MPKPDQEEIITFLSEGRAFGFAGDTVQRIDTHAAIIFLISDRAYKLKRAVRYSFLDFSTVERRHRVLEAECRLNRRTAPDLYKRLLPVTVDQDGHLALGASRNGAGEIVDWLLEMKRFDQRALFDHLAEQGRLDASLISSLAAAIADLHDNAAFRNEGGHEAMASIVDGNAGDLATVADDIGEIAPVMALIDATRVELSRRRTLLDRRVESGFVRHCHGDLHLGNIYLDGDRPVLFDCLEFDEALATIDVFYDLAFLMMDLCHRGLDRIAIDLLSAYLDHTEDDAGTALLPLFLAIRAAIRAKIEVFEIDTASTSDERTRHRRAALNYLALGRDLLDVAPPRLIAIGGFSGTGKSTVARLLAEQLGTRHWALVLRSDVIRKRLHGVDPTTRLDAAAYHSSRSADVYRHLHRRAATLLEAGRTVIADATFLDLKERALIEELARDIAVPFHGFWLEAPRDILEHRIEERRNDASDADLAVLEKQYNRATGSMTWTTVDTIGGMDKVIAEIERRISDPSSNFLA